MSNKLYRLINGILRIGNVRMRIMILLPRCSVCAMPVLIRLFPLLAVKSTIPLLLLLMPRWRMSGHLIRSILLLLLLLIVIKLKPKISVVRFRLISRKLMSLKKMLIRLSKKLLYLVSVLK